MSSLLPPTIVTGLLTTFCAPSWAQPASLSLTDDPIVKPSAESSLHLSASGARNNPPSWFYRHLPPNGLFELGTGLGLLFPAHRHDLLIGGLQHQRIEDAAELLVRAAWLPIRFAGVETEWSAGATKTADGIQSYPWAVRAQAIGQLPLFRITPFAVLGFGRMGNVSNSLGSDGDPLLHFGGGAKLYLTDDVLMRIDLRDNLTQKYDARNGVLAHSPELQVGVSLTLGRAVAVNGSLANCSRDSDADGVVDTRDRCPDHPGAIHGGCPAEDADKDGMADVVDRCPDASGLSPMGCRADMDRDGIDDRIDLCPIMPGPAPTGCPSKPPTGATPNAHDNSATDGDSDGVGDGVDKCPKEPETRNGFEDADGCPDDIPADVKAFIGVVQGITFEQRKTTIRPESKPVLDRAAAVLLQFPSLRVTIAGHTDNTGSTDKNIRLSKDRAEAVKRFFVESGISAARIETRGAGPAEPIDSNATAAGRERNRRIEVRLISE